MAVFSHPGYNCLASEKDASGKHAHRTLLCPAANDTSFLGHVLPSSHHLSPFLRRPPRRARGKHALSRFDGRAFALRPRHGVVEGAFGGGGRALGVVELARREHADAGILFGRSVESRPLLERQARVVREAVEVRDESRVVEFAGVEGAGGVASGEAAVAPSGP